ncbi:hypothetical protein KY332_04820 [Candidatus Woesearchaeota archaeon]|nr:hypothetical protein [Candidatus Woesearchaeota archaeon]
MRAYSTASFEMHIELSEEEIIRLEDEIIKGTIKMRNKEGRPFEEKDIELRVEEFEDSNLYAYVESIPDGYWGKADKFIVKISHFGYETLNKNYHVMDRMGLGSRVDIYKTAPNGQILRY